MNEDLASTIRDTRFTPVRLREGYDMGEVDELLDRLERVVLEGGEVDGLVGGVLFTPVRLREGYDMGEVDDLLDRVRNEVQRRAAGRHPQAPGSPADSSHPGNHPTPSPSSESAPDSSTAARPVPTASVIQEQRGLFSRLFGKK